MARGSSKVTHPTDKALLRPLAALSKTIGSTESSSFLRRTEYTASSGPQMFASGSSKDLLRLQNDPRRKVSSNVDKDDPQNILRNIIKGFDIAYPRDAKQDGRGVQGAEINSEDVKAWSNPKHPSGKSLQLLDSYPVLPDLDAMAESGSYIVCKFITNPVAATDKYDERLNYAMLQPIADPNIEAEFERKKAEWDPTSDQAQPLPEFDYDYFLPESEAVQGLKRKFDAGDPDHDDEDIYTEQSSDGRRIFKFARIRRYETYNQTGDPDNIWNDSVAMALHDPETDVGRVPGATKRLAKGAYLYPVSQRSGLRPKRKVGYIAHGGNQDVIDELDIRVKDLEHEDDTFTTIQEHKAKFDSSLRARPQAVA